MEGDPRHLAWIDRCIQNSCRAAGIGEGAGSEGLVGGSDAQALDARDAAVRTVVIPALFTVIGPRIWWPAKVDNTFR